jgi:protein gp37
MNCYAERMAKRLQAMGNPNYENGFELSLHRQSLELPLKWKTPQMIFVNSMSDLFHEKVPFDFIKEVFDVMKLASWHTFQVLTKRSRRLVEYSDKLEWPENVWMGVSVENNNYISRIDDLRKTNAFIKFVSIEPLLGPIQKVDLSGINWVIVGGESGPKSRPMDPNWPIMIKNECAIQKVPFFFKQWGGTNRKKTGRVLDGKTWDELPLLV